MSVAHKEQRREFIETIENLPEETEIYYAGESGFEEHYSRDYGYFSQGSQTAKR